MSKEKIHKIIENIKKSQLLDDANVNFIFNNLRNIGLSILPIILAKEYAKSPFSNSTTLLYVIVIFSIIISITLLVLNIFHGIRKISELKMNIWLKIFMFILYGYAMSIGFELLLHAQNIAA